MDSATTEMLEHIESQIGQYILEATFDYGELTLRVPSAMIVEVLRFLRNDTRCRFVNFIDLCGVDWPGRDARFDVVYHLMSVRENMRIRVKVQMGEEENIPSVIDIFPAAEWFEREAYDFFGIIFSNHPDLRRILTDYGFEGFPLRKDFPVSGFVELRYDDAEKCVRYEPVNLPQEFRNFDFMSPWEGANYILPGDEKASNDKASNDKAGG